MPRSSRSALKGREKVEGPHFPARGRDFVIIACILAVGLAVRLPFWPSRGNFDMFSMGLWAQQMHRGSLANAYVPDPKIDPMVWPANYPPGSLYCLALSAEIFAKITGQQPNAQDLVRILTSPSGAISRIYNLVFKAPAVLADLATGVILYLVLRKRVSASLAGLVSGLFLLQPALIYNSARWGQLDALYTLPMVLSLELATRRRYLLMTLCAVLALMMKLQPLILVPIWGLGLLLGADREALGPNTASLRVRVSDAVTLRRARRVGTAAGLAALIFALACVPFMAPGVNPWKEWIYTFNLWPALTANAFNLWGVISPLRDSDFKHWVSDGSDGTGSPAHAIGLLMLIIATAIIVARICRRPEAPELVRWGSVALCLAAFTFPTQVHERYIHHVIAIAAWAFVPRWWWWLLWLAIGGVYAVNSLWFQPFEPDWLGADFVYRLANMRIGGLYPSQVWGAVATAATLAVLFMPPRWWSIGTEAADSSVMSSPSPAAVGTRKRGR